MKKIDKKTIKAYIASFPKGTQAVLKKMQQTIQKVAPQAEQVMSYGIPTFKLNGNLVHFGGYAKHIGFYPGSAAIIAFKKELKPYKTSKGTIQFPLDNPIPYTLVAKITRYRVAQQKRKS